MPRKSELRAAVWTMSAATKTWHALATTPLEHVAVPAAPAVGAEASWIVERILRMRQKTCLLSALVRQRFYLDNGELNDVVVGVRRAGAASVLAHAWLEPRDDEGSDWEEIRRVAGVSLHRR